MDTLPTPPRAKTDKIFKLLPTIIIAIFFHLAVFLIFYFHLTDTNSTDMSVQSSVTAIPDNHNSNKENDLPHLQHLKGKKDIHATEILETDSIKTITEDISNHSQDTALDDSIKNTSENTASSSKQALDTTTVEDENKNASTITTNTQSESPSLNTVSVEDKLVTNTPQTTKVIEDHSAKTQPNISAQVIKVETQDEKNTTNITIDDITFDDKNSSDNINSSYVPIESTNHKDLYLLNIDLPEYQQPKNQSLNTDTLEQQTTEVKRSAEDLHDQLSDTIQSIKLSNQQKIQQNELEKQQAYQTILTLKNTANKNQNNEISNQEQIEETNQEPEEMSNQTEEISNQEQQEQEQEQEQQE